MLLNATLKILLYNIKKFINNINFWEKEINDFFYFYRKNLNKKIEK